MQGSVPELWKGALCGTPWGGRLPAPSVPLSLEANVCHRCSRSMLQIYKAGFAGIGHASTFCPAELAKASGKFQIPNGGSPPSPWVMPILSGAASMTSYLHCMQPEAIKLPLLLGMDFRRSRECPTHPWLQLLLLSQPPVLKAGEGSQRG